MIPATMFGGLWLRESEARAPRVPLKRRNCIDSVFRHLRRLAGFEAAVTVRAGTVNRYGAATFERGGISRS